MRELVFSGSHEPTPLRSHPSDLKTSPLRRSGHWLSRPNDIRSAMEPQQTPAPGPSVELLVHQVRGHNVLLDEDLAILYGTSTKRVNEQLRRNQGRFPSDFAFRLTVAEWGSLRSQSATSKPGRGGRRHPPAVFTEHGALMLANVLSSRQAVQASIQVVRAFVRLRRLLNSHQQLAEKLGELEAQYDKQFAVIFQVIRRLMDTPTGRSAGKIGFHSGP